MKKHIVRLFAYANIWVLCIAYGNSSKKDNWIPIKQSFVIRYWKSGPSSSIVNTISYHHTEHDQSSDPCWDFSKYEAIENIKAS